MGEEGRGEEENGDEADRGGVASGVGGQAAVGWGRTGRVGGVLVGGGAPIGEVTGQ